MAPSEPPKVSPFLDPGPCTEPNVLAILQLSRDVLLPTYLQTPTGRHDGYAEGHVVNTRYGSFPHSTMLGVPWGSQVRASMVDTGSRGRKRKRGGGDADAHEETEEKEEDAAPIGDSANDVKQAVAASSGFLHILPPTPENWTTSLPHRTQVVYTPDYSYILHRIRARPGSRLIEAGAGSGSFTHASARAVYNGYATGETRKGKVFSFEYHEQRHDKMNKEISDHGLSGVVELTHRDVYADGFLVDGKSPEADAIFLDLPAPWRALPHLVRRNPNPEEANADQNQMQWVSPLNPKKSVHLCTFSPCIEQVTQTVSTMRRLGWIDIEMVEIANRKLHTVRERVGLDLPADRGVNNTARNVEEALAKLTEIEEKAREQAIRDQNRPTAHAHVSEVLAEPDEEEMKDGIPNGAHDGTPLGSHDVETDPYPWMDGRLIIRGEPEIKTHTSYLVFAVLPREWTEEDEAAAFAKWPCGEERRVIGAIDKATRKKERRELLERQTRESRKTRKKQRLEAAEAAASLEVGTKADTGDGN